ncbi:hypothetical protein [Pedobacter sp. MR2016-24]|uniref:hypothetical protein n=1 Tax=Pedobacter sp. MR2016-24 TaxID=2994466 RepID=UPI002245981E|nr:hypothetical protein [Pedobacter sp. MR2016-24]MCX2486605.1 hypothetical protein [Pedobacter sp. MR2016-24]
MAINTDALSEQVALISDDIILKVIGGSATAELLTSTGNVQSGVKFETAVLKMDADVVLQDGDTCSRNPLDETKFDSAKIRVAPIATAENICPKKFYATYLQHVVSDGQNNETIDAELVNKIIGAKVKKIANKNEKLLWSGDVTLPASNELHFIDGIRKQVKAVSGTSITVTGATTLDKLVSAYKQANLDVKHDEDFYIFMGQDTYDDYYFDLSKLNIVKPVEDFKLYGSGSGKFKIVPGLDRTKEVYLGRLANLQMGTDGTDDSQKTELVWSVETKSWYLDFAYTIGIKVIYPEEFAYASIA